MSSPAALELGVPAGSSLDIERWRCLARVGVSKYSSIKQMDNAQKLTAFLQVREATGAHSHARNPAGTGSNQPLTGPLSG